MSIVTLDQDRVFWPRFQVGGFHGSPTHKGKSLNMTAREAYKLADKLAGSTPVTNGLRGIRLYGDRSGKDQYGEDDTDTTGIGPIFTLPEDSTFNNWLSSVESSEDEYRVAPNAFRTGRCLSHINAEPDAAVRYTSINSLGPNRGFYLRIAIPDWDQESYVEEGETKQQSYQSIKQIFGDWKPFKFMLEIWADSGKGGGRKIWLHRLSPDWTEELQATLEETRQSLEDLNKSGSVEDVALVEESVYQQQKKIYCQTDDLSSEFTMLKINHYDYGEFVFIPVGRNIMYVRGDHVSKEVNLKMYPHYKERNLTKNNPVNQMWASTPLQIACNGGVFIWQNGRVKINRVSVISLSSKFRGTAKIDGHWTACGPGCRVEFNLDPVTIPEEEETEDEQLTTDEYYQKYGFLPPDPEVEDEEPNFPTITFYSDGNYPVILYDFNTWQDAGQPSTPLESTQPSIILDPDPEVLPKAGGFDTNDHLIGETEAAPIEDIVVDCDGMHGKLTLDVTILTPNVLLGVDGGTFQKLYHDRMSKMTVSGQTVLDCGIINKAHGNNRTKNRIDQLALFTTGPDSKVTFSVADLWQIAEEWLIREDPILDGLRLGTAIQRLLLLCGTRTWQLAGIPINYGPRLFKSEIGKGACERPTYETSVADFIRYLMEKYAPNDIISPRTGIWTIGPKDTSIKAKFCENPQPGQVIPEFPILRPNDLIRDFTHTTNNEKMMGGKDIYGRQLEAEWTRHDAIHNPLSPEYVGRIKMGKTVTDPGKNTREQLMHDISTKSNKDGRPGNFFKYGTDTILNLYPGHRILVENNYCEIESLSDGSIAFGKQKMIMLARDLQYIIEPIVIEG